MTNQRAICLLSQMYLPCFDDEEKDALSLAINTLSNMTPTNPHRNYQYLSDYWCECGWHLGRGGSVNFCAKCGRRMKWDD